MITDSGMRQIFLTILINHFLSNFIDKTMLTTEKIFHIELRKEKEISFLLRGKKTRERERERECL